MLWTFSRPENKMINIPLMPTDETTSLPDATTYPELQLSLTARALFLFTSVILPLIIFVDLWDKSENFWRLNTISDYSPLFLAGKASYPFYPFVIYSMSSMVALIYWPNKFKRHIFVQFGVYSGVIVSIVYWLLFMFVVNGNLFQNIFKNISIWFFLSLVSVYIPWRIILHFQPSFPEYSKKNIFFTFVFVISVLIPLVLPFKEYIISLIYYSSASWAVASYVTMMCIIVNYREVKRSQLTLIEILGTITWLAAYFAAWRIAYLIVLHEYSLL
jgi:hypothetical protein